MIVRLQIGLMAVLSLFAYMVLVSNIALAQPLAIKAPLKADSVIISKEVEQAIYARLRQANPALDLSNLRPSPVAGIYQVDINGEFAFVSADGGFLIAGEMYQVIPGRLVNLQEQERREAEKAFAPERAKLLAAVDKKDFVTYTPEKETKGHIYVFTDIDCGFCRKLHGQMEAMLSKGIEVRYLAFPRAGVNSKSGQKLATTWCSNSPQEVMTRFKRGEQVKLAPCADNPIAEQYQLGQKIGVRGTPAIVLESGMLIPGAVSPEMLEKEMGI